MSKKSKRYGKWRKKVNSTSKGGSVGKMIFSIDMSEVEYQEVLAAVGMEMHFGDVINPQDGLIKNHDRLKCEMCIDYQVSVCSGRSLKGEDVIACICEKMGVKRIVYPAIAGPAYIQ